jgi:hypothetical protein
MNKKPSHEDIQAELDLMMASGKPKIIAARLTSLPLSEHIDVHLRDPSINYLWNLTPIKNSPIETDNGLHMGIWLTTKIDYVHIIIASKDVLDYYLNMHK